MIIIFLIFGPTNANKDLGLLVCTQNILGTVFYIFYQGISNLGLPNFLNLQNILYIMYTDFLNDSYNEGR